MRKGLYGDTTLFMKEQHFENGTKTAASLPPLLLIFLNPT